MAKLLTLEIFQETTAHLAVLEPPLLPIAIRRVFCIFNSRRTAVRGRHRHRKSSHVLICAAGTCKVFVNNGQKEATFELTNPQEALYLEPADWREMYDFSEDCVLLCLSDQVYDPDDYIYSPYGCTSLQQGNY